MPKAIELETANLKKKNESNRMKNQRDVRKILRGPLNLAHPIYN